jgi:hypothetical protein
VLRLNSQLSESGSAFSLNTISLANDVSFSAAFQFSIHDSISSDPSDGSPGADGLTFALQTVSNTAGTEGGGLGYLGMEQSVGIEFDTYQNQEYGDISSSHVGINLNGDINSVAQVTVPEMVDTGLWTAWVDYDGTTDVLEVRMDGNGVRSASPLLSYTVDLTTIFGSNDVYMVFTSATGGAGAVHDIHNIEFSDTYEPIVTAPAADVSLPCAFGALTLAMFASGWRRRA